MIYQTSFLRNAPYGLALFVLLSFSFMASTCEDDESLDSRAQTLQNFLESGTWRVTYFFDDIDETNYFAGYAFTFLDNGTVTATNGGNTANGSWSTTSSSSGLKLELDFGTTVPFDELNDDWKITEGTSVKFTLEDVSGGSGEIDYLTFEKN